jgi:hypothetical protein
MSFNVPFVQNLIPDNSAAADAGLYFTASMAPAATPLAYGIITGFTATAPAFSVQNTDAAATSLSQPGRNLHLKYLRFNITTAPATATSLQFAVVIDAALRAPTGGSAALTPHCVNSGAADATAGAIVSTFTGGAAMTVPAAVAARTIVGNLLLRGQIAVVNDEYTITFGTNEAPGGNLVTAAPNAASNIVKACPPIVLAPQHSAQFYLFAPGNTGTGLSIGSFDLGFTMK